MKQTSLRSSTEYFGNVLIAATTRSASMYIFFHHWSKKSYPIRAALAQVKRISTPVPYALI